MKRLKELTDVLLDNENMFATFAIRSLQMWNRNKTDCIRMTDSRNLIRKLFMLFFQEKLPLKIKSKNVQALQK